MCLALSVLLCVLLCQFSCVSYLVCVVPRVCFTLSILDAILCGVCRSYHRDGIAIERWHSDVLIYLYRRLHVPIPMFLYQHLDVSISCQGARCMYVMSRSMSCTITVLLHVIHVIHHHCLAACPNACSTLLFPSTHSPTTHPPKHTHTHTNTPTHTQVME